MTYIHSIVLGIIQGLTEFLPISSSGHLFMTSLLFDSFNTLSGKSYVTFFILLHGATLCAVIIFSRKIVWHIIIANIRSVSCFIKGRSNSLEDRGYIKLTFMVFVSTLITLLIALLVNNVFKNITQVLVMMGFFISIVFLLLPTILKAYISKNAKPNQNDDLVQKIANMSFNQMKWFALILGLVQGIAVVPGISRSGSTIVIGIVLGFSFLQSTRYSFLLAIPAILGALVLSLKDMFSLSHNISTEVIVVGMLATFISGLIGLTFLSLLAKKQKLWYFAVYLVFLEIVLFFV